MDTTHNVTAALAELESNGVAVLPGVLSAAQVEEAKSALWEAATESERRGIPTHIASLDPNDNNVRVFNLIDLDPTFASLISDPTAEAVASGLLGDNFIVSNFTANIARPGSRSMMIHSDQGIVVPEPWTERWSLNIIWCLSDVHADNGATRYLPGSHRVQTASEVPDDIEDRLVAFEAPAGSIVAMDGRVWHTSGANVTESQDRPLLFGYYTKPFVRPQWNFSAALGAEVQAACSPAMRYRLGLGTVLNLPGAAVPARSGS